MPPLETPVWWILSRSIQYSLIICADLEDGGDGGDHDDVDGGDGDDVVGD